MAIATPLEMHEFVEQIVGPLALQRDGALAPGGWRGLPRSGNHGRLARQPCSVGRCGMVAPLPASGVAKAMPDKPLKPPPGPHGGYAGQAAPQTMAPGCTPPT